MTTKVRMAMASTLLAAALGLLCASSAMSAAGEMGPDKDVAAAIVKLAGDIKKGDADAVKKQAAKVSAMKQIEENSDLMHLFKSYKSGGLGWGSKRSATQATDGLEKRVQDYAKNVKAADAADPMNEEAATWLVAMAEVIKARGWTGATGGGKTKKAWADYADQTREAAVAFSKAVASKNAANIKTAAGKLNDTCNACHSKFK